MTTYQVQTILAELDAETDPKTTGYVFMATADLFMSTIDYDMTIEDLGGEDTIVGVNKITTAKAYLAISVSS